MITFAILYRLSCDNRNRFVRIEARRDEDAVATLGRQLGGNRFTVTSIRSL